MFREAFEKLDLAEVATLLDIVNPAVHGFQFDPVETTIMAASLPFYPGWRLLDIADYSSMPPSRRYAVASRAKAYILNFTNEPIYALNHEVPIKLDDDTVTEYVKFFFSFVRGRHGRFIIAENIDDIHWKDDPPPQARKAIGRMVIPVSFLSKNADASWELEATMMFKDSLFKSKITVKPDGAVSLHNEELLIEDMPILDDTFGQ